MNVLRGSVLRDSVLRDSAPWLLFLLFAVRPLAAQRPLVETFSLEEGLPSSTIYDLAQDASGRLWIAGRGGVTSYDGRTFRTVTSSEGLPSAVYQAIAAADDGRLWALTRARPRVFLRHGGEGWRPLPAPPLDLPGQTWASSMEVISEDGRTLLAVGTTREGLWLWDGRVWQRLGAQQGLPSPKVTSLERYRGGLAVATAEGLCELHDRRLDCHLRGVDPRFAGNIVALHASCGPDEVCKLWVAGPDWAGYLHSNRLEVLGESLGLQRFGPSTLGAIAVDTAGGVYVGAPNRGWFWDPVERRFGELGPRQGFDDGGMNTLLVDREANLWIGSYRGLAKICSRRFLSFDRSHGLLESEVTAVFEPEPGVLLLGHNRGLTLLGPQGAVALPFPLADTMRGDIQRILDIAVDARGDVWLAAQAMGLLQLTADRSWNVVPGIAFAAAVETDPWGRLWVLEPDRLLVRDGAGFTPVELPAESDALPPLRWIRFSSDGRLHLATRRGLLVEDDGRWQMIHAPTPEADDIYNLLVEPSGDAWVGTAAGLYRLRGERLVAASLGGRRLDRPVYQIFDDARGRIWFGTDDGVWRWDAAELSHFTIRHGLAGRETNRGAGFVDHRGRVWIGTDQGLSMYQEVYDQGPISAPVLEVRRLEISGVSRPFTAPVELGSRQSTFTFHVDLIALSREEAVEWRYRLEGFDDAWQGPEPFTEGGIRYTNVPAGRHRLRIAARWAGRDLWSEEVVSPKILLRGPLWKRPWFLAVSSILFVGSSALVVAKTRARARRLEAINQQLAEQMAQRQRAAKERERLIRELESRYSEIERFTYTLSHDLKTPIVTVKLFLGLLERDLGSRNTEGIRRDMDQIRRASDTMGTLLDGLRLFLSFDPRAFRREEVALSDVIRDVLGTLAERIDDGGVEVRVGPELPTVAGDPHLLGQALRQLIDNALVYMGDQPAPRIEIGAHVADGGHCAVHLRDNGMGIEPRYHEKIFDLFERLEPGTEGTGVGLAIVKRIVELHGGRIWVESEGPGRGSTFCFTLGEA